MPDVSHRACANLKITDRAEALDQWPREDRPWLMELLCHHGKVYPWGGEVLQAMSPKPWIGAQLLKRPRVLHARGADEVVIRFHVAHIDQVLAVLKPYRRRQVSEAQRERLQAIGFQQKAHTQSDYSALGATNAGQ